MSIPDSDTTHTRFVVNHDAPLDGDAYFSGSAVDLAELYGVATKRLNEAVRRNAARFPEDFMFQLAAGEVESMRSQFANS